MCGSGGVKEDLNMSVLPVLKYSLCSIKFDMMSEHIFCLYECEAEWELKLFLDEWKVSVVFALMSNDSIKSGEAVGTQNQQDETVIKMDFSTY